ncbi:hypothetical protein CON64_13265 [Bacillus pseudomycoides]|nr:hypothetical protein CON64_13265 [Bacillus pseudomycoides]
MTYGEIFFELLFGYAILFGVVKVLGKTQINQITTFDFISALVLGNLLGDAIYDKEADFWRIAFSLVVWGAFIFITGMITQKWRTARLFLEGKPCVLVSDGRLHWEVMKKNRLDVDQFQQLLRAKDVFSLQDVEFAILENDGSVSVMKKANADSPTREDLKITNKKSLLPIIFISDGQVITYNLKKSGLNEEWLYKELKKQKVKLKEVCYAEWEKGGALFVQKY